jgi:Do/DeqQ family serine protease
MIQIDRRPPGSSWRRRASLTALAAWLLAAAASAQTPAREMPSLAPMIEAISPAVVNISVTGSAPTNALQEEFLRRFFEFELPPEGRDVEAAGSGVIIDAEQGYVLTNHHVIENADKITVTLLDNRSMVARVVGSDQGSDLAVLQVAADDLAEIRLGDSSKLRVGDYVVAIGNPFGFSHTVTSGIVSALGRSGINRDAYEDFIQTDASINPGNSGGALVNLNGELVGVNSAIISRSGGNVGIGFAIPVNMARAIMEQLIAYGTVSRGLLGVSINDVTPEIAASYGLRSATGALVALVNPNSAAERAGILVEDVIVSIDGNPIRDSAALRNTIGLMRPGDEVRVGLIRDGRELTVTAMLGELATSPTAAAVEPDEPLLELDPVFEGAQVVANDPAQGVAGLLITRVDQGSPAAERGLRPGDVITHVNRVRVREVNEATELMRNARSIILLVQRGTRNQLILMR